MSRPNLRSLVPFVALFTLAGCGGGGGTAPVFYDTDIRFAADEAFSGSADRITLNQATATVGDGYTDAILNIEEGPSLRILLPTDAPSAGQSFTLSGDGEATVEYSRPSSSSLKLWASTGGTVTITAVSADRLSFRFNAVRIEAQDTGGGSAEGSAVLNGTLGDVVRFTPGGSHTLEFTAEGETSADLSDFAATSTVTYVSLTNTSSLSINDPARRALTVGFSNMLEVGSTVDATSTILWWNEGNIGSPREAFQPVSGSIRIVRRSRDAFEVEFIDVRFEPSEGIRDNQATGAFVVNGTLAKP